MAVKLFYHQDPRDSWLWVWIEDPPSKDVFQDKLHTIKRFVERRWHKDVGMWRLPNTLTYRYLLDNLGFAESRSPRIFEVQNLGKP